MLAESVESGVALHGSYDVEAEVSSIPAAYGVKGMFFERLVVVLGPDFDAAMKTLEKPPLNGRYVAFRDYPGGDFARLAAAAARKVYPRLGLREGVRRIALDDFKVFADSMVGKVTLAVASGARSVLNNYGPRSVIHVYELDAGHIRFDVEHSPAPGVRRSPMPTHA